MSQDDASRKATELARKAGLTEPGLVVVEGFAGSSAAAVDMVLGDVIPGTSLLTGKRRRFILVAIEHVHIFAGQRFGGVGERLGTYGIAPGVMVRGADSVTFPDGLSVGDLTGYQIDTLARAVQVAALTAASADFLGMSTLDVYNARQSGTSLNDLTRSRGLAEADLRGALEEVVVDFGVTAAQAVAKGAAITTEQAVAAERAESPKKTTAASRLLDATIGTGDLDFRSSSEPRIVLVTDRHVYVFEGRNMSKPGKLLSQFAVDDMGLTRAGTRLTLPDGEVIDFKTEAEAKRIADATARPG